MSVVIFVAVLAVLILSHEFGHFIVAKRAGVCVDEFGLGFPPRLLAWKRGETTYSLNLLPFGGFVKIFGENPDEESLAGTDARRGLGNQPKYVQAAVLAAGVVCNWLLAWLFLSAGFLSGLPVAASDYPTLAPGESRLLITSILPASPADQVGLKPGDEIVALSDTRGETPTLLSPQAVADFVAARADQTLDLTIKRSGSEMKLAVKPAPGLTAGRAAIGVGLDEVVTAKLPPLIALWQGAKLTVNLTLATVLGFGALLADVFAGQAALNSITGPVGLAGLVGDAAALGLAYLLSFTAFISINLAVLNLLPFPALDGGRLLFLLIEKIKGSAIAPRIANALNLTGFILLLVLMVLVTYSDIRRLFF